MTEPSAKPSAKDIAQFMGATGETQETAQQYLEMSENDFKVWLLIVNRH